MLQITISRYLMKYYNENLPLSCGSKTSFPWLIFSILSVMRERKIDEKNIFSLRICNLKERKEENQKR